MPGGRKNSSRLFSPTAILLVLTALFVILLGSCGLAVKNPRFQQEVPGMQDVSMPAVVRYLSSLPGHAGTPCYGVVLKAGDGIPEEVLNLTALRPELGSSLFRFVAGGGFDLAEEMFRLPAAQRPQESIESLAGADLSKIILPTVEVSQGELEAGERFVLSTGFNYDEHQKETDEEELILVSKLVQPTGAYQPVQLGEPQEGQEILADYELEIGFVLLQDIDLDAPPSDDELRDAIAFFSANDVSDRWPMILEGDIGFTKGKSNLAYLPLGPWMIHGKHLDLKTKQQGRNELGMQLWVDEAEEDPDGSWRQATSSADMILGPAEILGAAAQLYDGSTPPDSSGTPRPIARRTDGKLVLPAGSIILTGTPGGTALQAPVGMDRVRVIVRAGLSMKRARRHFARHCVEFRDEMGYLKAGDTVESTIQHLGHQRWAVVP